MTSNIPVMPLPSSAYEAYAPRVPSIGKNLKAVRIALGLTQEEAAERCRVAQNQLSKWEKGRQEPTVESLLKLAVGLQQPIESFVIGVNRKFDLACQMRDQQSDLSATEGAEANVPAAARIHELESTVATLRAALAKTADVAGQLVQIAKAGVEGDAIADGGSSRSRRDRKAS